MYTLNAPASSITTCLTPLFSSLLAVTLERFLAIVFPLRSYYHQKKYLLPVAILFAVVYNLPKYFEVKTVWHPELGIYQITATSMRQNPNYVSYYVVWSKLLLTDAIPYFFILILNVFIIFKTVKGSSFRKQFNVRRRAGNSSSCKITENRGSAVGGGSARGRIEDEVEVEGLIDHTGMVLEVKVVTRQRVS